MKPRDFANGVWVAAAALTLCGALRAEDRRTATVGMPARIEQIVLPGPELEVRPLDNPRAPVVLRIANVYPHGSAFRYDLVYYGLEPGTFDLKDYLRPKDGSAAADLPSLPVVIKPVLPPGQIEPNALELKPAPFLGGYRFLLVAGGILWCLGLVAILLVGRRKNLAAQALAARPVTLADRLRPLVEKAMTGKLTQTQRADLERILLAYWRRRLRLDGMKPAEAFAVLRRHAEAGPLVEQLEAWLHRPSPAAPVDVSALLRPYQHLPADAPETGREGEVRV